MMEFKFEKLIIWQKAMEFGEVVTCLHKANNRKYISAEEFQENYKYAFNLMNMMVAFKERIK